MNAERGRGLASIWVIVVVALIGGSAGAPLAVSAEPALPGVSCRIDSLQGWTSPEQWAWTEICEGRTADFNRYLNETLDPGGSVSSGQVARCEAPAKTSLFGDSLAVRAVSQRSPLPWCPNSRSVCSGRRQLERRCYRTVSGLPWFFLRWLRCHEKAFDADGTVFEQHQDHRHARHGFIRDRGEPVLQGRDTGRRGPGRGRDRQSTLDDRCDGHRHARHAFNRDRGEPAPLGRDTGRRAPARSGDRRSTVDDRSDGHGHARHGFSRDRGEPAPLGRDTGRRAPARGGDRRSTELGEGDGHGRARHGFCHDRGESASSGTQNWRAWSCEGRRSAIN